MSLFWCSNGGSLYWHGIRWRKEGQTRTKVGVIEMLAHIPSTVACASNCPRDRYGRVFSSTEMWIMESDLIMNKHRQLYLTTLFRITICLLNVCSSKDCRLDMSDRCYLQRAWSCVFNFLEEFLHHRFRDLWTSQRISSLARIFLGIEDTLGKISEVHIDRNINGRHYLSSWA